MYRLWKEKQLQNIGKFSNGRMANIQEKFKVDLEELKGMQINQLKLRLKEGERHLKYWNSTMSAFKYPEKRMKCQDTKYYEEVVPEIKRILEQLKEK